MNWIRDWVSYSFPQFIILGAAIGFIAGWIGAFILGLGCKYRIW